MKILTLPKAGGKTTTLIKLMIENPSLIYVAPTEAQAAMAFKQVKEEMPDISRDRFLGAHRVYEAMMGRDPYKRVELVVDELDSVVERLLGAPVFLATRTG